MKQTTKLAAADLVLPQLVPLCPKFSSDGENSFVVYTVLGIIASFIFDDH